MSNITRDRWGRPLITPPTGDDPVPYLRASSVGKILDDEGGLARWRQRMTAIGLANNPELIAGVVAAGADNRRALDDLCEKALERGGGTARRDMGTALHKIAEDVDSGIDVTISDPTLAADVDAYRDALNCHGIEVIDIECFVVNDTWCIGGTFDRLIRHPDLGVVVADIKTGSRLDYSWGANAIQLACYAHGERYDADSARRSPLHSELRRDVGVIIHLPAGEGRCELWQVDLTSVADKIDLAMAVRDWRRCAKHLATALDTVEAPVVVEAAADAADDRSLTPEEERRDWIESRVAEVKRHGQPALGDLVARWPDGVPTLKDAKHWTTEHLEAILPVLEHVEATHALPWEPPDPTAEPVVEVPPTPKPAPVPEVIDEGADVDDDTIATLMARVDDLAARGDAIKEIVAACGHAGHSISLRQHPSTRRVAIVGALVDAARSELLDDGNEDLWRAVLARATDNDACTQPGVDLGEIVGLLTTEQAHVVSDLASAFEAGTLTITSRDDGAAVVAE